MKADMTVNEKELSQVTSINHWMVGWIHEACRYYAQRFEEDKEPQEMGLRCYRSAITQRDHSRMDKTREMQRGHNSEM